MKKVSILLTGGAGFIGSHIAEKLLADHRVHHLRILDNLSTGSIDNLHAVIDHPACELVRGDICDADTCTYACEGMDMVCHQAALGSVPRSIELPLVTNAVNITGTLNVFSAAQRAGIRRVVYAASSSTYGDSPVSPRQEESVGKPISPYAVTKLVNELYAHVFGGLYRMEFIGLRYFNVFGPRQDPDGAYAAVIPRFMKAVQNGQASEIHGDGLQTRDFTYVGNVVDANLLALFTCRQEAINQVVNIAGGEPVSILELYNAISQLGNHNQPPTHGAPRKGDVRHSIADISKATELLGYAPTTTLEEGLKLTWQSYLPTPLPTTRLKFQD